MDAFANPGFAAAALSFAWIVAARRPARDSSSDSSTGVGTNQRFAGEALDERWDRSASSAGGKLRTYPADGICDTAPGRPVRPSRNDSPHRLPQGGFQFESSRAGVRTAVTTAAKGGAAALVMIIGLLACRASAMGAEIDAQDCGFAAGLLPIIGSWRYVLAETTSGE